jgi:hypothetical protein
LAAFGTAVDGAAAAGLGASVGARTGAGFGGAGSWPNSSLGITPTTEAVRQVARKPAIIAFQTMPMISARRSGTSTE